MEKNQNKTTASKNSRNKLLIPLILLVVVVAILSIIMYAHLTNLDRQIASQELEITELKKNKISLEGDMVNIKSSGQIEEEAMYKLGMVHPTEDQIVYIELGDKKETKDVNQNVFLSPVISVLKSYTGN